MPDWKTALRENSSLYVEDMRLGQEVDEVILAPLPETSVIVYPLNR